MPLRVSSLIVHQPNTTTTPQLTNNNLELVCRTCLKNCTTRLGIFNHRKDNILVADMLVNCTSLELHEEDGFPVNICNKCMEKLTCAFDFKTMVIESDIKLKELRQHVEVKKEGELCSNDEVERRFINEEVFIKNEQTDVDCKNEDTLGNQANEEEVNVKVEFESLKGDDSSLDDFVEASRSTQDLSDTENYKKKKRTTAVADVGSESEDALRNRTGKGGMDTGVRLEFESPDENADVSDVSVEATSNTENPSEVKRITPAAKQGKSQTYYDEKNAELLDNPDYKRITSSGLTKEQRRGETVFCADCNKTYSYKHYIEVHAYIHTGKVLYKCDECGKCYSRKYMLKDHMRSHSQTRDFVCDECGKAFIRKQHLKSHKIGKHSEERPYKCNVCDKTFKRSSQLMRHCLIHMENEKFFSAENKNFICSTCGEAFARKKSLSLHLKIHRSDNSYNCNYCGKQCLSNSQLKAHSMIHTDAKPFACGICSRTFNRRGNVRRHMRVHAGETPYPCKLCPSNFKYQASLGKHMKVHEKEQKCSDDNSLVKDC